MLTENETINICFQILDKPKDEEELYCPVSTNQFYKVIDGTCFYFETAKLDYDEAKQNCKGKFGPEKGRLFEPKNVQINQVVWKQGNEFKGDL